MLVQPVHVELAGDFEHEGRAVELERPEGTEPGVIRLAGKVRLDPLQSLFPQITGNHGFHHRAIPIDTHPLHALSTRLSTNDSGRTGLRVGPLRPKAVSYVSTFQLCWLVPRAGGARVGDRGSPGDMRREFWTLP